MRTMCRCGHIASHHTPSGLDPGCRDCGECPLYVRENVADAIASTKTSRERVAEMLALVEEIFPWNESKQPKGGA